MVFKILIIDDELEMYLSLVEFILSADSRVNNENLSTL